MGVSASIDLKPADRTLLDQLIQQHLPGVEIWAFGSRIRGAAMPNSDLDLVAFNAAQPAVGNLKEAFAESDLTIAIDLHSWEELPEKFQENIKADYVLCKDGMEEEA